MEVTDEEFYSDFVLRTFQVTNVSISTRYVESETHHERSNRMACSGF